MHLVRVLHELIIYSSKPAEISWIFRLHNVSQQKARTKKILSMIIVYGYMQHDPTAFCNQIHKRGKGDKETKPMPND